MQTFSQVLESADELSREEKEDLITILQKRLQEQRRAELINAVKEARQEFKAGHCRPASVHEILRKVLA